MARKLVSGVMAQFNQPHTGELEKDYHGGTSVNVLDYTKMVWRNTTSVGCGTGIGSKLPYCILVCRYYPLGNIFGQKPC